MRSLGKGLQVLGAIVFFLVGLGIFLFLVNDALRSTGRISLGDAESIFLSSILPFGISYYLFLRARNYDTTSLDKKIKLGFVILFLVAAFFAYRKNRHYNLTAKKFQNITLINPMQIRAEALKKTFRCPNGGTLMGAYPPVGKKLWCEIDNIKNGPFVDWDSNNQIRYTGDYKNGELEGYGILWAGDQPWAESVYHRGDEVSSHRFSNSK